MSKKMVLTTEELAENELLNDAIAFAVEKHKNGLRKGTKMPYIVHPLEVLHILMLMGADKNLMAAGVLHDTVEDTDATLEEIAEKFGEDVATLVASHTEKDKALPWKTRKEIALEHLKHATKREQMLVLGDKLSNMRAIALDYDELGVKLWERFNRGLDAQAWYYHRGAAALAKLGEYDDTRALYEEFAGLVDKVFGRQ
ncbi:MAG: HD domain-containing protein [Phascolarctobacterium sp.]